MRRPVVVYLSQVFFGLALVVGGLPEEGKGMNVSRNPGHPCHGGDAIVFVPDIVPASLLPFPWCRR
jgi:hypothetical protein